VAGWIVVKDLAYDGCTRRELQRQAIRKMSRRRGARRSVSARAIKGVKRGQSMIKRKAKSRGQFLAKMHEALAETKARLMREIAAQLRTGRDISRDDCMDSCDLASEENEREMSTMLSERERLKVGQIDDALRRIASLKYGLCQICGLDVTEERLKAMPFTRLCCDCQQEREREARTRRHHEEHDYEGYKLGPVHAQEEP
jgi:DnaK suppressor protein